MRQKTVRICCDECEEEIKHYAFYMVDGKRDICNNCIDSVIGTMDVGNSVSLLCVLTDEEKGS